MTTTVLGDNKKVLLSRLLDSVKGCQKKFGSRTELATENEDIVAQLCVAFEDIFVHGIQKKAPPASKGLWQMTENLVPSGLRSGASEVSSFWPLIKSQLSKHEAERFLLLQSVRTDLGRTRAWLRASLNEHSLERYILIVLSLDTLHLFYESWAFLRDPELSSILPQTAAGLGSVFFALRVDNPNLDKVERVMDKSKLEPIATSAPEAGLLEGDRNATLAGLCSTTGAGTNYASSEDGKPKKTRKKKKKVPTSVVSFEDPESGDSELLPNSSVLSMSTSTSNIVNANANSSGEVVVSDKEMSADAKMSSVETPSGSGALLSKNSSESMTPVHNNDVSCPVQIVKSSGGRLLMEKSPIDILYSTSVQSADCLSIYSDCSDRVDNISMIRDLSPSQRLKPVEFSDGNSGSGGHSFILGTKDADHSHCDLSQLLIPVPIFDSEDSLVNLAPHSHPGPGPPPPSLHLQLDGNGDQEFAYLNIGSPATPSCSSEPNSQSVPNINTKTNVSIRKDSIGSKSESNSSGKAEERLVRLKAVLDHEVEMVATLRAQLAEERRNSNDKIKMLESKSEAVTKENEILKHQLKKYVAAVQLLKRDNNSRRASSFEEDGDIVDHSLGGDEGCTDEGAEYERKLIQVAEMHGELMEFNSHLQRCLQRKEHAIRRLREVLVDLRGPPAAPLLGTGGEEDEDHETWDFVTSAESSRNNSRPLGSFGLSNERILVNIWIPSAFLTGATNDLHHVYQVFVRIKDTEWNVYRRYSQFYSLHRDMKKKDNAVASFYFPPKKHLGNKDAKFVDERRRKLQEYLRKVMNYTLQTNAVLAAHPDKNLLISILPFFGEYSNSQTQKPKRERSRSRNLFFRQTTSSTSGNQQHQQQQQLHSTTYPQYTGL